jgi:hypothetical protein
MVGGIPPRRLRMMTELVEVPWFPVVRQFRRRRESGASSIQTTTCVLCRWTFGDRAVEATVTKRMGHKSLTESGPQA